MLYRRFLAIALACFCVCSVRAGPFVIADMKTGQVLIQSDATRPWFPASTTKLMTFYVALNAVRAGRLTFDTPMTLSRRAAHMPPSKMGLRPGTRITLENALKMMMVKSANDIAWMIAENIDGTTERFVQEMNRTAAKLGMRETHFVNPNGLHNPRHYSSVRDMALLARALQKTFPEYAGLLGIEALQFGKTILHNHNGLLRTYPGANGMKTGFTCPAGWNIVASAERGGRRLLVVIFGAPTPLVRNQEAALLFNRGFAMLATGPKLEALPALYNPRPPSKSAAVCHHRGKVNALQESEDFAAAIGAAPILELQDNTAPLSPVPVFIGVKPGWRGPILSPKAP